MRRRDFARLGRRPSSPCARRAVFIVKLKQHRLQPPDRKRKLGEAGIPGAKVFL